jgi:hypothetical protein
LENDPDDPDGIIYLPELVEVRELAVKLAMKPFKIVAELMELGRFKHADESIDFETASIIARKHGRKAVRCQWVDGRGVDC